MIKDTFIVDKSIVFATNNLNSTYFTIHEAMEDKNNMDKEYPELFFKVKQALQYHSSVQLLKMKEYKKLWNTTEGERRYCNNSPDFLINLCKEGLIDKDARRKC